jgi:hypothetical protein
MTGIFLVALLAGCGNDPTGDIDPPTGGNVETTGGNVETTGGIGYN